MNSKVESILQILNLVLLDEKSAFEFVLNELSFANKSSLAVRNFVKSSGVSLKGEPPILELDNPSVLLSNLLSPLRPLQSTIELRLQIIDEVMRSHRIGKYRNKDEKEKIRHFCNERKITNLIHFTKIENIIGILDIGINSQSYNYEIAKKHRINDTGRFDYRTHMISLSISYPNDKMFYKYRKNDPLQQWVVLCISPSVLWELDCLFCPTNAANSSISSASDESLSGSLALEKLFSQQTDKLKSCYPYDSQAEVLVNNHIPSRYIQSIFIDKNIDMCILSEINYDVRVNSFYFQNRDFILNKRVF